MRVQPPVEGGTDLQQRRQAVAELLERSAITRKEIRSEIMAYGKMWWSHEKDERQSSFLLFVLKIFVESAFNRMLLSSTLVRNSDPVRTKQRSGGLCTRI